MKNIIFGFFIVFCALFYASFQQSADKLNNDEKLTDLPWQLTINADGSSTVFGQTIGKSTLADIHAHVIRQPQISLFRDQDSSLSLEAMFEKIDLSGIISNLIIELAVDEEELKQLEKQSLKREVMPSGAYRLTLSQELESTLQDKVIKSISYTPTSIRLTTEMIELRFGKADEIIVIDEDISHHLYPKMGLDIILNLRKRGKEVFQYLNPADFDRLRETLYGAPIQQQPTN